MKKRAQITMETLLLYGVAILIVLLAIAALTYFGVLDLGGLLPERCNLESTGIFKCEDYYIQSNADNEGTIKLQVANTGSKAVKITQITFTSDNAANCQVKDLSQILGQGTSSTLQILPSDGCEIYAPPGTKISGKINIQHNFINSDGTDGLVKTTVGDVRATVAE